jgi:hypothetical protein
MKLKNRTQKTIKIDGTRYDYGRILRDLCHTPNRAGNYWINDCAEAISRCNSIVIQSIDGHFAVIER